MFSFSFCFCFFALPVNNLLSCLLNSFSLNGVTFFKFYKETLVLLENIY